MYAELRLQDSERCNRKKVLRPAEAKEMVAYICEVHKTSISRACRIMSYRE